MISLSFVVSLWFRGASVCTVTGYGVDDRGLIPGNVQSGSGAHPAPYLKGTFRPFPEVKRPGCEVDHSLPPNAEVNNSGAIPSLPICLHTLELN
jgi:hypothetical protein